MAGAAGPADVHSRAQVLPLRVAQVLVALWLLGSTVVLAPVDGLVLAKDVVAGSLLLAVTAAGPLSRRLAALEGPLCLVLGVLLVLGAVVLDPGTGRTAALNQWNEVVVGVVLVCLWAGRSPAT